MNERDVFPLEFELLIRRDPARRGLISSELTLPPLLLGELPAAAEELHRTARRVALVTGFFVPRVTPPCAETDGPPGTWMLADVLERLGIPTLLITDEPNGSAVRSLAERNDSHARNVAVVPLNDPGAIDRLEQRLIAEQFTHLISLERIGPSHTAESFRQQRAQQVDPLPEKRGFNADPFGSEYPEPDGQFHADDPHPAHRDRPQIEDPERAFLERVPVDSYGLRLNMRGVSVDAHTAPLDRLFESSALRAAGIRTIGIGDGGNEIGMGKVPWEELALRLPGEQAARIPCRIACDWTILAGVSNWGGYALAAAICLHRGEVDLLRGYDCDAEYQRLCHLVEQGPAVDGVTGERSPTVDGLPFLTYIQPWLGIRRMLDLPE